MKTVYIIYARKSNRHNWLVQSFCNDDRLELLTRATVRDWSKCPSFQFAVLNAGELDRFETVPNNCKQLPNYPMIDGNIG